MGINRYSGIGKYHGAENGGKNGDRIKFNRSREGTVRSSREKPDGKSRSVWADERRNRPWRRDKRDFDAGNERRENFSDPRRGPSRASSVHALRDARRGTFNDSRREPARPSSSLPSKPVRIPIDLKPSGVLTKYLHLTHPELVKNRSKYVEPGDAVIPTKENCKFHLFKYNDKIDKQIEIPLLNFKSYFIIGRSEELADIVIKEDEDGDLVSKEHAVIQFRSANAGDKLKMYLMDIGSTNGTFLNDDTVELPTKRYIELKSQDIFKVGDPDSILEFMIIEDL